MRRASLALLGAALVGCGDSSSGGDPGVVCPAIAAGSVQVSVVDAQGAAVLDAKVTYSVDGGAEQPADCVALSGAGCSRWVAGWERTGSFVVRAASADGAKQAEAAVVVVKSGGDCPHVVQQAVKLTL